MSLLEFKQESQFLQQEKLSFLVPVGDEKTHYLQEDCMLEFDENFYYITKLGKARRGGTKFVAVEASALWYRLGERGVSSFTTSAVTPFLGLTEILASATEDGLDWTIGNVSASGSLYSADVTDSSYLDLIYQWAKICGCEVAFDTNQRLVHMVETIGGNYGLSFRYNRNLTEIEQVVIPPAVTRLYPYGRDDLTIAGQNAGLEYLEDYSFYTAQGLTLPEAAAAYRKDYRYKDDSFIDDASLYQSAVAKMAKLAQPYISYTAKVADLSRITGYSESRFGLGDYAVVDDEELGISVIARVVRFVRYPYEPHRNEVELAFDPIGLPDPNVSGGRSDVKSWELFVSRNTDTPKTINIGRTVLHRMPLIANKEAEWIITYSFQATCTETGTLQITFTDDLHDTAFLPTMNIPCVAGQEIRETISLASEAVPLDSYRFVVRAEMTGSSGAVSVAAGDMNLWVFARGVVRGENPSYVNTQRFNYTGASQLFRFPDDVHEVFIEVHGPGFSTTWGSGGGFVSGYLLGNPGDYVEVNVGGQGTQPGTAGWPNAGIGRGPFSGQQGGCGSSDVRPVGAAFVDAHIVAAGAGGHGEGGSGHTNNRPGYGGFEHGGDSERRPGGGGTGASQTAGGTTGGGADGAFNSGGAGGWGGSFFEFGGGGGGGGWYGGSGGSDGGGGGGGSGHVGVEIYDYEWQDNENTSQGFIDFSWADPAI